MILTSNPMNNRFKLLSLFLVSAASLLFEIDLSRLFSVAQFYHFAFMVVSLALLGFGASGTALALFPSLIHKPISGVLGWFSLGCGISILGAYLLTNGLLVDSFSIAWDPRQALLLGLHYLVLTLPFFFSGLAVGALIAESPQSVGGTYAANLTGSALGCLAALAVPGVLGGEGIVTLSSGLAFLAALCAFSKNIGLSLRGRRSLPDEAVSVKRADCFASLPMTFAPMKARTAVCIAVAGLVFVLVDLGLRFSSAGGIPFLKLQLSPYKGLSYILQQPGAKVESSRWNAFSRVDTVSSSAIHSFPGLSYRFLEPLPSQKGLLVDGDDLSPLLNPDADLSFSAYLPDAIAYELRPQARVLVLGASGGLEVVTALAQGAGGIDAVEANPLIIAAVPVYSDPRVRVIASDARTYLRSLLTGYDVIVLPLNSAFHPIRSGAYSLAEDYRFTVEAFEDLLSTLSPDGILAVTRWLQDPPSEDLRTFALAITALENLGLEPGGRVVVFRGYNTATFLVRVQPFSAEELDAIRQFTRLRAFDLSYAPGILPEETNRYNVLSESIYYQAYRDLLAASPREAFYQHYPYDVSPPTDDHPFFGHFFKWSQSSQILAEFGKTFQPFGGAGYFVILALLLISIILAICLILLPLLVRSFKRDESRISTLDSRKKKELKGRKPSPYLVYFGLIGLAYLFVEIPLIQKFILFLGHPAYAMTAVLFTLLLFSGIGSLLGKRISLWVSIALLALILVTLPAWMPVLFELTLGAAFVQRLLLTILALAPVGFLMGIPFQAGIRAFEASGFAAYIPWAWAVNGSTSVVSAVLAALLALTFGFNRVLWLGALCYAGALVAIRLHIIPRPHAS